MEQNQPLSAVQSLWQNLQSLTGTNSSTASTQSPVAPSGTSVRAPSPPASTENLSLSREASGGGAAQNSTTEPANFGWLSPQGGSPDGSSSGSTQPRPTRPPTPDGTDLQPVSTTTVRPNVNVSANYGSSAGLGPVGVRAAITNEGNGQVSVSAGEGLVVSGSVDAGGNAQVSAGAGGQIQTPVGAVETSAGARVGRSSDGSLHAGVYGRVEAGPVQVTVNPRISVSETTTPANQAEQERRNQVRSSMSTVPNSSQGSSSQSAQPAPAPRPAPTPTPAPTRTPTANSE